jgi:hypothetical protein
MHKRINQAREQSVPIGVVYGVDRTGHRRLSEVGDQNIYASRIEDHALNVGGARERRDALDNLDAYLSEFLCDCATHVAVGAGD